MATNYTTLVADKATTGSILHRVNYARLDAEGVLEEAQTWIYDALRVREMITADTLSIAVDDTSVALPAGFLEPLYIGDLTNDCEIIAKTEVELEQMRTYASAVLDVGQPMHVSVTGSNLELDCKASAAATWRMVYFKQPDFLSLSNEENFLTTRYPHLLRKTIEAFAFSHRNDDSNYARSAQQATAMIIKANEQNERYRHGTDFTF